MLPVSQGARSPGRAEYSVFVVSAAGKTERMAEERVAALFGQGLFPTVSNVGIGAIAAAAMAPAVGRERALVWLAVMVVVTLARAGLWGVQRVWPESMNAAGWLRAFTIGGTFNGLTWGAMALLMWPPDAGHRALIGFIVGGMVASSTAVVPAHLPAFYWFTGATLLPPIVHLVAAGVAVGGSAVDITMGTLLTTFGLAMGKLARRAGLWFEQNTELRLHNADLVEHLELRVKERTVDLEQKVQLVREAEARAQSALRDRDEFLAIASHELRTPIATLELQLSRLAPSADEFASVPLMRRQLRRLTGLVDLVLTASGVGRKQAPKSDVVEVDLAAVLRTVVDDVVTHSNPPPVVKLDLEEPMVGSWDAGRLEQVISNLLSNAIKYGAGTPIEIRLAAEGETEVVLTVADQGPGIAPANQARVFERFFRAETDTQAGGLGLGLAVVRELVETMAGTVALKPTAQGATFTIRLPRSPPPPPYQG
jgi:signal transduction histidine kinase